MGLEMPSVSSGRQTGLAREDADAVQRLRQNYPPHILTSLFDGDYITSPRASLISTKSRGSDISMSTRASEASSSSLSSSPYTGPGTASTRSSIPLSPGDRRPQSNRSASYTLSIPPISEWSEISKMYKTRSAANRSPILSRSISDRALRDHALGVQSFSRQELFVSTPVYFCVHCGNGFEKRGDWETHEWIFHERQSYWPCPQSGCDVVFDSGTSFEAHHEVMHGCSGCKHSAECVRLLPERKVWACGFDGCKAVFLDWSRRCKHVASHYEGLARRVGKVRETPAWKYSVTVRNLLRQPDTREHFKKFMIKSHGHSKTEWPALNWQRDSSAELKRRLEYRDFPDGVTEIVQQAYRLGHPASAAAVQNMSRPPTPPPEGFNLAHLSPTDGYFGSTGPRSVRSQRSYLYERKSNSSNERAAPKTASLASSRRPGRKRLVAREAEVRNTSCSALASFLRDGPDEVPEDLQPRYEVGAPRIPPPVAIHRSRLVAREAEVRNTRNPTLASILRDGPPDFTGNGESHERKRSRSQSIPQLPAIRVAVSPFADYVADGASLPRLSPTPVLDPRVQVVSHGSQSQMTGQVSRPQILPPKSQPHSTLQKPLEDLKTTYTSLANRRQKPQLREIQICENVLNLPRSSSLSAGTWVLPPTPGPPPIMALPKTPAISILSPMSGTSRNCSDSPISPISPTDFNFSAAGPPPSPMPPGFSEIQWPLPPTPAVQLLLECIPTSTTKSFKEASLTSRSCPEPRPDESSPISTFPQSQATDGSRTAHGMRIAVPKLMKAPPKRSRSMHRSGSKSNKSWTSISSLIEPPLPSPGIDFGFCLSQPIDLGGGPAVER